MTKWTPKRLRAGAEGLNTRRAGPVLAIFAAALFAALPVQAQTAARPVTLTVTAEGPLPGFRPEDATHFLTQQMSDAGISGWHFAEATGQARAPDRIEWHFELDPYAGGGVRQFFPMAEMQKLFGLKHRISAEARLYLDGQYQTLMFGQATIQGGANDKDLAAFVTRMTGDLLGEHGAYRAIDMNQAQPRHP